MLWFGLAMVSLGLPAVWYLRPRQVKPTLENTALCELAVLSSGETERLGLRRAYRNYPCISRWGAAELG